MSALPGNKSSSRPARHEILLDYVLTCFADNVFTPADLVNGGVSRIASAVAADGARVLQELKRGGGRHAVRLAALKIIAWADKW